MEPSASSEQSRGHLDPEIAQMLLESFPQPIREAYVRRTVSIDYPVWAVIELALARFLGDQALGFLD